MVLFDRRDLAEITHPGCPGERSIACSNLLLAEERKRKRRELLAATEKKLDKIVARMRRPRRPLRGSKQTALEAGKLLGRSKMSKHFKVRIEEDYFSYERG